MHIIIAVLGAVAAICFFVIRARNAAHVAGELVDVANDVRLAARRFGFRRQTNVHPVETIEDPRLAVGAIATAFLELDDLPTKDQRKALHHSLRDTYNLSSDAAEEITVLGHWFVSECGGPDTAVSRLARKLFKLEGSASFETMLALIRNSIGESGLNHKQREALDDIRRAFKIR